jgi:hypothetical protein
LIGLIRGAGSKYSTDFIAMIQLPYADIGLLIAIVLMVLAFIESELKGRCVIVVALFISFILPRVFPSSLMTVICAVGRLLFAVCCFIFLRYRRAV